MPTELKAVQLQIDPDPRLAAAAGGAAHYLANSAGLESAGARDLQSAVIAACQNAFPDLEGNGSALHVDLTQFSDRIEVALYETPGTRAITRLTKYTAPDRAKP